MTVDPLKQPDLIPDEQIFGIAKRITLELDKLPLQTHASVVAMCQIMTEHRKVCLQNEQMQRQQKAQEDAMADARAAHAKAQAQREADEAERLRKAEMRSNGIGLVAGPQPVLAPPVSVEHQLDPDRSLIVEPTPEEVEAVAR